MISSKTEDRLIEEAERKFGAVGQVIDEEALAVQKFMKSFDDLSITIKSAIVDVLNPVLAFLSKNTLALTGVLSIFAAPLVKSIIPSFEDFGKSAKKARDPNSPNNLSRKKWKCIGKKSKR